MKIPCWIEVQVVSGVVSESTQHQVNEPKMKLSFCALAMAVGFTVTPLLAQQQFAQQQQPQQQELSPQQSQQSAQAQQQVRDFFHGMESSIFQAIRNGNFEQAAQYFQTSLAKSANFFASNEVYLNNNLIASGLAELNHSNLSQLLGFAAARMQMGQKLSNYDLNIRIQEISFFPGGNVARVRTTFGEYAALPSDQPERDQQQTPQTQQPGRALGQGGSQRAGAELDAQARCTHILFLTQGSVQIGDSFCRAQTRILTDGQM